jgi:hypothetical protein
VLEFKNIHIYYGMWALCGDKLARYLSEERMKMKRYVVWHGNFYFKST